ncbi:MAG: hypothetical protein IPF41_10545 [Flavobacteriales bacterium]|nr:hypothetical protein [Flavobacteriales bacterium]
MIIRIRIGEHGWTSGPEHQADGPAVKWPAIGDTITRPYRGHRDQRGGHYGYGRRRRAYGQKGQCRFTITSFDTGYWAIPPFKLERGRTSRGDRAPLRVDGFAVEDTAVPADIKPIQRLPSAC